MPTELEKKDNVSDFFKTNVKFKDREKISSSIGKESVNKDTVGKIHVSAKMSETVKMMAIQLENKLNTFTVKSTELHYFSQTEMETLAVCEITKNTFSGIDSLNDPRLGVIDNGVLCATCGKSNIDCPGHCGFLRLPKKFLNPTCSKEALYVAQSVCNDCGMLILDDNTIISNGLYGLRDIARLKKFYELSMKNACRNKIIENGVAKRCRKNPIYFPSKIKDNYRIICDYEGIKSERKIEGLNPFEPSLEVIFKSISQEDIKKLGFENGSHPLNFIMGGMLVIPPKARPPDIRDGEIRQDYLTNAYKEIMTSCEKYKYAVANPTKESIDDAANFLHNNICKFIDSGNEIKSPTDPTVGIKQKLLRKEGYIRKFVMGKRVNHIYRSPAGPGSRIKFGYIGIPKFMRKILTVPEKIHRYNYKRLMTIYNKGEANYFEYSSGGKDDNGPLLDIRSEQKPGIGDTLHRWLEEGDINVSNRQPTLHKFGFLGQKLAFHKNSNIITHPSQTTPYNLDYDGDELNGHIIQSKKAQAECLGIVNAVNNVMSDQSCRPAMGLIFNSPASAYILSKFKGKIEERFWNECMKLNLIDDERLKNLEKRLQIHGIEMYSGRALFSTFLPSDFYYCKKGLVIKNGVLISGHVTKDHIGPSTNSIIHVMHKMYSKDVVSRFFTEGQWVLDWFITWHGLSIGYSDCLGKNVKDITKTELTRAKINIDLLDKSSIYYEKNVLMILSNVANIASKKAVENLNEDNTFLIAIKSKAKGSELNIAQIMGLLGQQNINDKRPVMSMNNGRRSTTFFDLDDDDLEARGFIPDNYLEGVSPKHYFFHLAASRENLVDTAVKTANVGDLHHRIGKVLEDVYIDHNGCVCDKNTIFQFCFGDGFDPKNLISTKHVACGELESFIDWETVIGKLNNDYETKNLI